MLNQTSNDHAVSISDDVKYLLFFLLLKDEKFRNRSKVMKDESRVYTELFEEKSVSSGLMITMNMIRLQLITTRVEP